MSERVEVVSRAVYWGFWLRVTKWAATLFASVLVVRMLGKDQYGLLSVIRIFVSYSMIFYVLGLDQAILRYLPEIRTLGSKGELFRFLRNIFCLQSALWFAFFGIVFLFLNPISRLLGEGLQKYLCVAIALSFFTFLQLGLANALTTFYEMKGQVLSGALGAVGFVVLLYGTLQRGWGIWAVLFSEGLIGAGLSFWFLRRVLTVSRTTTDSKERALPISLSRVLKFSFPYVCMTLLTQIIWRQSELFFLAYYQTPGVVGIYNIGFSLPQLVLEFVPSFLGTIGVVGAVEQFIKGVSHLSKGIVWYYKILFFLLAPLITGGALFSDRLIYFLYGPEFALSGLISQIYFILFTVVFLITPYGLANIAEERIWISVILAIPTCLLNLLLDFFWIKRYGLWGAVGAVAVTQLIGFVIIFIAWKRIFPYVVIPWKFIGKCFLATAPFLIFFPLKHFSNHLLWFLLLCALMGGIYLLAARGLKLFGAEELELLERSHLPAKARILAFLKG